MHGRVKVRTTAEQEAIKNAERAKKVKEYRGAMHLLLSKRKDKIWDSEYLMIISKMLLQNPDMTTLWNMRREVFETMNQESPEYLKQMEDELTLTEECLKENPKSYFIWHHRCWVIEHMSEPNWKKELKLCAFCLKKDERNFHCWDYRNFLVNKANVSDQEEFEFSTSKIFDNFSNYSSWHYRSKLLSKMFPDEKKNLPIREDKHKEELDLVMDATFTDPYDSSAWFYQRWLLEPRTSSIAKVYRIQVDKNCASIVFHKEVQILSSKIVVLVNDNKEVQCNWKTMNEKKFSKFCSGEFTEPLENSTSNVKVKFDDTLFSLTKADSKDIWIYKETPVVSDSYNEAQLIEQLKNYKQLSEMEPNNKWSILTGIFLMKNINFLKYYSKIVEDLGILMKIDSLRLNYYIDLRSKYVLEHNLIWKNESANQSSIDLSGLELTTIYYEEYLNAFEEVDLSNNHLNQSIHLLYSLQNCSKLSLTNNGIEKLENFPRLQKLKILNLQNNEVGNIEEVVSLIKKHELEEIDLRNNPVNKNDIIKKVNDSSLNVKIIVD